MCEKPDIGYLSTGARVSDGRPYLEAGGLQSAELPSVPAADPVLPINETVFDGWGPVPTIGTLIEYEQAD